MNATRLFTKKFAQQKQVLSIGIVQTPTLAMIVNRQLEIDHFKPEDYWELRTIYPKTEFKRIGRINALFTQVQQLCTAVDSSTPLEMQPNPAERGASNAENLPSSFPLAAPFSDNQHGGSLPRRCERSILIGIVGLQARQSNRPRSSSAGGARLSGNALRTAGFGFVLQVIKDLLDHYQGLRCRR